MGARKSGVYTGRQTIVYMYMLQSIENSQTLTMYTVVHCVYVASPLTYIYTQRMLDS